MERHTISISLVHEAVAVARQRGVDIEALLLQAQIPPDLMAAPLSRVTAQSYAKLWSAVAAAMDDEFFGMDSHPMRRGSFRLMCLCALGCATLGEALKRMLDFLRLVLDDVQGILVCAEDRASIVLHDSGLPLRAFSYATYLLLVHGLACWLVGRRLPLQSLSFRCAEPPEVGDYRTRFCESLAFEATHTQALMDASLLDLRVVQDERSAVAFLAEAPGSLLVKYRNEASLSTTIRRHLRRLAPEDWPDVDSLASSLQ
ncbi:DNA-binding domain-containing protein, AraC-type (fragment) [Cupriavidus necator]|uniref:DNA-binding domain-containing protein, AraC-type n=1 Tax=Cupriavidus necator TaxID=106590 RepID=A0A1K0J9M2_CUPNE